MNNSLARHNIMDGHEPDFERASVLAAEKNKKTREQKENWFITKNEHEIINHLGIENKNMSNWINISEQICRKVRQQNTGNDKQN